MNINCQSFLPISPRVAILIDILMLLIIKSSLILPKNPSKACLAAQYGARYGFGVLPEVGIEEVISFEVVTPRDSIFSPSSGS